MQHAVDVHRLHRGTLQRGQQDAAQGVAERLAEAALERFSDNGRKPGRIGARRYARVRERNEDFSSLFPLRGRSTQSSTRIVTRPTQALI